MLRNLIRKLLVSYIRWTAPRPVAQPVFVVDGWPEFEIEMGRQADFAEAMGSRWGGILG